MTYFRHLSFFVIHLFAACVHLFCRLTHTLDLFAHHFVLSNSTFCLSLFFFICFTQSRICLCSVIRLIYPVTGPACLFTYNIHLLISPLYLQACFITNLHPQVYLSSFSLLFPHFISLTPSFPRLFTILFISSRPGLPQVGPGRGQQRRCVP